MHDYSERVNRVLQGKEALPDLPDEFDDALPRLTDGTAVIEANDAGEADDSGERLSDHEWRKRRPLDRGVLSYFPDALLEVAHVSYVGNEQHNPGQPMHWSYGASMDHGDCILRHQIDRRFQDKDGLSHAAKVAWRALAQLQTMLEEADADLHDLRQSQRESAARGES